MIKSSPNIGARWWRGVPNCGDTITSYIAQQKFGKNLVYSKPTDPHLLGVGSVLFMANLNSIIWGSGVLDPTAKLPTINPSNIRALRGHLSAEALRHSGVDVPHVPTGDPGFLVEDLVNASARRRPNRYRAAIIPHWTAIESSWFDKYRASEEFILIDMRDQTTRPLDLIAQSERVVSMSLHGLIFAEALGKPTLWISDRADDTWCFKFRDWYSNCLNPQKFPHATGDLNENALSKCSIKDIQIDKDALLSSFPSEEGILKRDATYFSFAALRNAEPLLLQGAPQEFMKITQDLYCATEVRAKLAVYFQSFFSAWPEKPLCIIPLHGKKIPDEAIQILVKFAMTQPNFALGVTSISELLSTGPQKEIIFSKASQIKSRHPSLLEELDIIFVHPGYFFEYDTDVVCATVRGSTLNL